MIRRTSLIVISLAAVGLLSISIAPAEAKRARTSKLSKAVSTKRAAAKKKVRARPGKRAQPKRRAPLRARRLLASTSAQPRVGDKKKTLDPLEAALARATRHGRAAPVTSARDAVVRSSSRSSLVDLRQASRNTAGVELLASGRDRSVPSDKVVKHMSAATLGKRAITKVVRHNLRYLEYCHQNMVARKKAVFGDVSLEFVVEARGSVSEVRAHASGRDAALLEDCIERRIAKWRFPAADAPTMVEYPLVFETAR